MNKTKNIWIGVFVIALVVGVYYFGTTSKNSPQPTESNSSKQIVQYANQIPTRGSIQNQTQCVADGKVFFQTHWTASEQLGSSSWTYDGPEYHSSQKLKTCLVYVGETSPFNNNTFSTHHNLYVYDIYANPSQPILQSSTDRTCPPGGQCTETLGDPITFSSNIPNLSTKYFSIQKNILFSQ